MKLSVAPYI